MNAILDAKPANFTRRSKSFVRKFIRERRFHLVPVYWLLRLSDFAREGMENSGSYRFADHMYRNQPSGRGWLGRWIDSILLKLPSTRSMRQRCFQSRDSARRAFDAHCAAKNSQPFRILTVPCGLPRDVRDFATGVAADAPTALRQISYTGIDLDPKVIDAARAFLFGCDVPEPDLRVGNALDPATFQAAPYHFIASTGLGEFLQDEELARFYRNVFDALERGGTFFTSAAAAGTGSKKLLEAFELTARYRTRSDIERALRSLPWTSIEITQDAIGLQTFVRATK